MGDGRSQEVDGGLDGSDSGGDSARFKGGWGVLNCSCGCGFGSSCLRSDVLFSETRMVRRGPPENGVREDLAERGSSTDSPVPLSAHLPTPAKRPRDPARSK